MSTILVVDDEPTIRMLVRLTLEREGHEVLEADAGATGLALAEMYRPDLVLLDVALPQLNGLEVARRLGERTPVLLLTGLAPEPGVEAGLPAVRGFVEKPFSPAALSSRVQDILESEAMAASEAAPAA
jgi:DNA-binding response OmpR family regulator